jgi:hypothetical protein
MDKAPVYPGRSFKAGVTGDAGCALMVKECIGSASFWQELGQNPGDISTLEE